MSIHTHPRVTSFAVAGEPDAPTVCVRVEVGELGVWIARPWPGAEMYVVEEPDRLRTVSLEEAAGVLDSWPAIGGRSSDAIQAAVWLGRHELLPAVLRAVIAAPAD